MSCEGYEQLKQKFINRTCKDSRTQQQILILCMSIFKHISSKMCWFFYKCRSNKIWGYL